MLRDEVVECAAETHGGQAEPEDVGVGVVVVLVPAGAGRHPQDVPDRDLVEGGAGQYRHVGADRLVDAPDVPLLDRDADEGGDEALGHRHGQPWHVRPSREQVSLVPDLAVDQHEKRRGVRVGQELLGRPDGAVELVRIRKRDRLSHRPGVRLRRGNRLPGVREVLDPAEVLVLRGTGEETEVAKVLTLLISHRRPSIFNRSDEMGNASRVGDLIAADAERPSSASPTASPAPG